MRLLVCACLPEPELFAVAIGSRISCADPLILLFSPLNQFIFIYSGKFCIGFSYLTFLYAISTYISKAGPYICI